ncbi:MAG: hypothetical protein Q4C41_08225 [Eggerthellaceae bacterium]|nr:hypothetical protein [Eggerthellaceae bacterium]
MVGANHAPCAAKAARSGAQLMEKTEGVRSLRKRMVALFAAVTLCVGLVPVVPTAAWAAESGAAAGAAAQVEQTAGTATLTIVKGVGSYSGPSVVVNEMLPFKDGATAADFLATAQKEGLITGYAFDSTYDEGKTYFLSSLNGVSEGGYWMSLVDGDFNVAVTRDTPIEAGKNYQFYWLDSAPGVAPTADQWKALKESAQPSGTVVKAHADASAATDPDANSAADAAAAGAADTVTLSIVTGVGYNSEGAYGPIATVNKTYQFDKGATADGLLAAVKAEGDISDYAFNSTYDEGKTYFLSSLNGKSEGGFWMSQIDGDSSAAIAKDTPLETGKHYQLYWLDSAPGVAPSADQWAALAASAAASDGTLKPTPSSAPAQTVSLDGDAETTFAALYENLPTSFAGAGGSSAANVSSWNVLSLAAAGKADLANKDAAISEAVASFESPDGYNLQRSVLVLTALGVDATAVPTSDGSINLIDKLANTAATVDSYPTSVAYTLLAYACGNYEVPASSCNSPRALLDKLAAAQEEGGGFSSAWGIDVTAMVIPALAAYSADGQVQTMMTRAVESMRAAQEADGGFGNVNSTAVVVVALCAAGVDPNGDAWSTEAGGTPLRALLAYANEDLSGFAVPQGYSQDLANQQGFMALAAYQGLKNTGAAYNIYTQAAKGEAVLPPAAQQPAGESKTAPVNALVQTGDATPVAAVSAAALLGALACAVAAGAARRREIARK